LKSGSFASAAQSSDVGCFVMNCCAAAMDASVVTVITAAANAIKSL
jgi:hypothetical protein